uniref:Ubiquitin-like protease family profile domain-containing protein n=2 Tax=Brassica oleracea TaxID=3712 RepID=A0A0D2ZQN0_BRAOL|nr:unnamed protein product [Brassica oleracea]
MTTRRRRPGKEHVGEEDKPGGRPDERLPERLFATDRYPSRRLNVYSSLNFLVAVKDVLRGTPEMDRIMGSCFGKLFELPVHRCSYPSVMIHTLLARQLVTKKRYEAWPVFGGNPLRFPMVEFGRVTGLPCGEFEEGYVVEMKPKYKEEDYAYWDKLFDSRRDIMIPDVVQMVTEDLTISRSRRLKLCLIIIVDGVLIASTHPARPTLKHVKRVENLKNFLAFQWGRESFYWTATDMIPPKRVMGVCDDPPGEFCTKLRQKTKKMTGLPLALQLVAYECIPQLLARLGGNDDLKIIDCESLPQHTGLNLVDVLEAEHHSELTVQPMMEIGPNKPDGWGELDDEIHDRRMKNMVRLIEDGHNFTKSMWRGGDAAEDLYDHEKHKAANKRKRQAGSSRTNVGEACVEAETGEHILPEADFGRRKRTGVTPRKEIFCSGGRVKEKKKNSAGAAEVEEQRDKTKSPIVKDVGEDVSVDVDDVGIGNEKLPAESEDVEAEEEEDSEDSVGEDVESEDDEEEEDEDDEQDKGSRATDVEMEGMSSEEPPEVHAPLKEGDGVPLQWVDAGATAKSGCVLYKATTSKTFFGCGDGGASGKIAVGEAKDGANVAQDGDEAESKESDGVIAKEHVGSSGDGGIGDCTTKVSQGKDDNPSTRAEDVGVADLEERTEELFGLHKLVGAILMGASGELGVGLLANAVMKVRCTNCCELYIYCVQSGAWRKMNLLKEGHLLLVVGRRVMKPKDLGRCVVDGVVDVADAGAVKPRDGGEMITCSSDSSPCPRSEKHKPPEAEANLASLLLAKEPFSIEQIVHAVEDIDFGYFEKVLLGNPEVYVIPNPSLVKLIYVGCIGDFLCFLQQHMEVLVDYVSERHGAQLKENRAMFVDPWFVYHLLGKARSFKAATYKGRVFSDPKLAGYLTQEGKKLGVDVDKVYGPMIWRKNHWVGLAINIPTWSVQVFDSDHSLRSLEEVMVIMSPIARMLPYLVRKVCPAEFLLGHGLEPFAVERLEFVYQNRRSGDCGPVAVKFLELSATAVEQPWVGNLTDNAVDILRKQYVMDVYQDWIVPLYMGGDAAN